MATDFIYEMLRRNIIKSYTSGDLDNSINQLDVSLHALICLYDKKKFQNSQDLNKEKIKLLVEIQEVTDRQSFRKMYGGE